MPHFLLELFSEEIPARMQADAAEYVASTLEKAFATKSKTYVTPRRLSVIIENLPENQPDISEEIKGPKQGAPEVAMQGFLKKTGITIEQLTLRDGIYFANIQQKGRPTAEVLKPLIEEMLAKFPWPKSMRWGSRDETWVRPLHSILCILGSDVVPVEFAGIQTSNVTYGHRFLAPQTIQINNASEYVEKLQQAHVIADRDAQKLAIKSSLEEKAATIGLIWQQDNALLEEVVGLVEWPVIMFGKVDEQFMHLPPELLTTVMRSHQKYFTLVDKSGAFSSTFAFAANRDTATNGKEIIAGNERVLRARFSDAKFFYEQDQKKPLAEWNKGLEKVIFHAKIGTVAEKVERIGKLCTLLRNAIGSKVNDHDLQLAARICKADLVTGMVGEFPELQGIMGSYYARAEGMSNAVCEALEMLYKHHEQLSTYLPQVGVAEILYIADRLDTLIELFRIGEKPTGSKDPYALRRAALGVIAIIRNASIRINLGYLFPTSLKKELLEFFSDRVEVYLQQLGTEKIVIRAIGGLLLDGDIIRLEARAQALQTFLNKDESKPMLAAYKRACNILDIEEKKDGATYSASTLDAALLKENAEKSLHQALVDCDANIAPLLLQEKFTEAMQQFTKLKSSLDVFFNDIMVNDKNQPALRANRLSLLACIKETMHRVADFSQITG